MYSVIISSCVSCARAPRGYAPSIFVRSPGDWYHGTCPASSLVVGNPVERAGGTVVAVGILAGRSLVEEEGIVVADGLGEDTAAIGSPDVDAPARRGIVDRCGSAVGRCTAVVRCTAGRVPARCRCRGEGLDGSCPAKTGLDGLRPSVCLIQVLRH